MRTLVLAGLGISALALTACMPKVNYGAIEASSADRTPLRAVAALDCPDREGDLVRTGRAADGRACDYSGPGETVRLTLVDLGGRAPAEALAPLKAELHGLVPVPHPSVPEVSSDEPGEHAKIDLPFLHIRTAGERADVRFFGVKIHSDGDRADVDASRGGKRTLVHAGHDGAEITVEDQGHDNVDMVYVLAADHHRARSGYAAVGYVAKGPTKGPLVVGEFRATRRTTDSPEHHDRGDLGRLIDRNVRG